MHLYTVEDVMKLDEVSRAEVEKIVDTYKDLFAVTNARAICGFKSYEHYDSVLEELKQTKDIKKRRAILKQMIEREGLRKVK